MTASINGVSSSSSTDPTPSVYQFPAPAWGYDPNLTVAEANFQAAMNLGAIADEIDTYNKSLAAKPPAPDQSALAEIKRLGGIIQAYQNQFGSSFDSGVAGWVNTLFTAGFDPKTGALINNGSGYLTAYRLSSTTGTSTTPSIVDNIISWMTQVPAPFTADQNTNPDTLHAFDMFMTSFYGFNYPDLDGNMEQFFSQQSGMLTQYDQSGIFESLYMELHDKGDPNDPSFKAEMIATFTAKDPDQKLKNYDLFLAKMQTEQYTPTVQGDMTLEEALEGVGSFGYQGFNSTGSSGGGSSSSSSSSVSSSSTSSVAADSTSATNAVAANAVNNATSNSDDDTSNSTNNAVNTSNSTENSAPASKTVESGTTTTSTGDATTETSSTKGAKKKKKKEKKSSKKEKASNTEEQSLLSKLADALNNFFKTAKTKHSQATTTPAPDSTTSNPASSRRMSGTAAANSNSSSIIPLTQPPAATSNPVTAPAATPSKAATAPPVPSSNAATAPPVTSSNSVTAAPVTSSGNTSGATNSNGTTSNGTTVSNTPPTSSTPPPHPLVGNLGSGSENNGILPPPPGGLPPTGAPDGSLPDVTAGYTWGQGDDPYLDKMMQFIEYFGKVKTTDTGAVFNLMNYITALAGAPGDPLHNDSALMSMISKSGVMNMAQNALQQAVIYSFFEAQPPSQASQAMISYIQTLRGVVNGLPASDYKTNMLKSLNGLEVEAPTFAAEHTAANGDLIWTDTSTGMTYDWTHPNDPYPSSPYGGDQFMIQTIIGSLGASSGQQLVTNCKEVLKDYRVNTFDSLMNQFPDPMFVILLWFMSFEDQDTQATESGENDQAQVMSSIVTDYYANGFQALAGSVGYKYDSSGNVIPGSGWNDQNTEQFTWLLNSSDTFMEDAAETTGSFSSNWEQTGTGPIGQIMVPGYTDPTTGQPGNLKAYLNDPNIVESVKTDKLNTLFAPYPQGASAPPSYQANTTYQALTQATTGMVQLGNGQTKNITTSLGSLSALETAIDHTLDQIVNATTGLVSMILKFISNQHSN